MRPTPILAVFCLLVAAAPAAAAAPPLVLEDGRARPERDRVQRALPPEPLPRPVGAPSRAAPRAVARSPRPRVRTRALERALVRLRAGGLDPLLLLAARDAVLTAREAALRLGGFRAAGVANALRDAEGIAARGLLTRSRVRAVALTLRRNVEWWSQGTALAPGQRVRFGDSFLVWQYYPGHGIQLQMLGSWGAANGYWRGGERYADELASLVDELVPLASRRAGGPAWEYFFAFGGGLPPWTSGMSQGTAVQALARASVSLGRPDLLDVARRALGVFRARAPVGVRVPTKRGAHYLLYSFAPRLRVYNGFAQAVIGLLDLAALGGGPDAGLLATAGEREARDFLPRSDTGSWSRYAPGIRSSHGYHVLLRDFLRELCRRTDREPYCATARRFTGYLE